MATDELKELYTVDVLGKWRAGRRIKSSSCGPRNKRIRVTAHGAQENVYKNVKQARVSMDENGADGLEAFVEPTVDALIASSSSVLVEAYIEPMDRVVQGGPGNEGVAAQECYSLGAEDVTLGPNSAVEIGHAPSPLTEAPSPKRVGLRPIHDGEGGWMQHGDPEYPLDLTDDKWADVEQYLGVIDWRPWGKPWPQLRC